MPQIELCNDIKRAVPSRYPKNMSELKQFFREEWSKIPLECCTSTPPSQSSPPATVLKPGSSLQSLPDNSVKPSSSLSFLMCICTFLTLSFPLLQVHTFSLQQLSVRSNSFLVASFTSSFLVACLPVPPSKNLRIACMV